MIAGVLTGGIGLAGGLALSGAKYEYVDGYNVPKVKMKYKGKELQKLQSEGVHIIIVEKAKKGISTADEVKDARESCKSIAATPPPEPAMAPATTGPATPQQSASPNVATTLPQPQKQRESPLGDVARKYQQQKQQEPVANKKD